MAFEVIFITKPFYTVYSPIRGHIIVMNVNTKLRNLSRDVGLYSMVS